MWSRDLRKVYEVTGKDLNKARISPFLMAWPPVFPVLKE
uniref:F-box protein AT5G49610-like beta-propeller domain-containing protein n=1 Tax=Arundo donax TaxID=35708 RepID=A0A0A9HDL1_ARUDO